MALPEGAAEGETGKPVAAVLVSLAILLAAAVYVAASLRGPDLPTFRPTKPEPREVAGRLVGPITYTVDSADPDRWVYFDFSQGSVVEDPPPLGWDLAFRRYHVIVNGGPSFPGRGGIHAVPAAPLEAVRSAPGEGYVVTAASPDTVNAAVREWYDYSWVSHLLRPHPATYVVRTADGRYAKLEFLSYYCSGARPGCMTFRYLYQGDGSRRF